MFSKYLPFLFLFLLFSRILLFRLPHSVAHLHKQTVSSHHINTHVSSTTFYLFKYFVWPAVYLLAFFFFAHLLPTGFFLRQDLNAEYKIFYFTWSFFLFFFFLFFLFVCSHFLIICLS